MTGSGTILQTRFLRMKRSEEMVLKKLKKYQLKMKMRMKKHHLELVEEIKRFQVALESHQDGLLVGEASCCLPYDRHWTCPFFWYQQRAAEQHPQQRGRRLSRGTWSWR